MKSLLWTAHRSKLLDRAVELFFGDANGAPIEAMLHVLAVRREGENGRDCRALQWGKNGLRKMKGTLEVLEDSKPWGIWLLGWGGVLV